MTRETQAVSAIKVWIFPTLVSLVSLLIWNDVNEIKADVKALMAQSNIDKTRIDNLERIIYKRTSSLPFDGPTRDVVFESFAILPNNRTTIKNKQNEEILF
jgi:hypothetical protein